MAKVTSEEDGQSLAGVTVSIKGKTVGTFTDENGAYSILASEGETLSFSFIGFVSTDFKVSSANTVNVRLKTDLSSLGEVVVVGYGTQSRKNIPAVPSAEIVEHFNECTKIAS